MLIPFDIAIYLAIAGIGFGYYIRACRDPKPRKVVWPDGTALRQYDHPAAFVGAWNGDAVEAIDGGDGKVYRNLDEYRRARARSVAPGNPAAPIYPSLKAYREEREVEA